jgi:DUF4097 and DUF4098 domain-containing protein YvlB
MIKTVTKIKYLFFHAALLLGLAGQGLAQKTPPPTPPDKKSPLPVAKPAPAAAPMPPAPLPGGGEDYEKSLVVDAKVNIGMCVLTGDVKINGWDRNEVRVFIKDGSNLNISVRQKDAKSGQPVVIALTGKYQEGPKHKDKWSSECIMGNEIEIDVPRNAAVTVKGQEMSISIDSVRKAFVKNAGGNITLRNIMAGVDALTYEGDVTVNDSAGPINLENSSGNILAFNVKPGDVGDTFKAKTSSGKLFLQQVEHQQMEAGSISGSILFDGKLTGGGQYRFSTSNGLIGVTIPADSSFTIVASYGYGNFFSEIPLKVSTQNNVGGVKVITATTGTGDATLNITTNSGSIKIKKP